MTSSAYSGGWLDVLGRQVARIILGHRYAKPSSPPASVTNTPTTGPPSSSPAAQSDDESIRITSLRDFARPGGWPGARRGRHRRLAFGSGANRGPLPRSGHLSIPKTLSFLSYEGLRILSKSRFPDSGQIPAFSWTDVICGMDSHNGLRIESL